jgi:hypothetical protein
VRRQLEYALTSFVKEMKKGRGVPVEPAGTCPGYESLTLDGSEDPWTTG